MSAFSIRPAEPADAPTILALIRELAEFERLLHEVTATAEDLQRSLFEEPRRVEAVMVCEDGASIGFALFFHNFSTFLGKPGLYVEDIYIQPAYRGRGYGRAVMLHLARLAVERGCGRFEWAVLDWNQPARDFYRSLGAEEKCEWIIERVTGEVLTALARRAG
jgi:GNAT superfamily N-acetyltransferase